MAIISGRSDKKNGSSIVTDDRVEERPDGKGYVIRSGKIQGTLSPRTSLINGLTIAQQDPDMRKASGRSKNKKAKPKVGLSKALLKK